MEQFREFLLVKVDMWQFSYTMYAKTLTELRNYVRGIPFDEDSLPIKMQTFDDITTNFSPPISDKCMQAYHCNFYYVPMEGMHFADRCPRQPIWNMLHIALKDKKAKTSCLW